MNNKKIFRKEIDDLLTYVPGRDIEDVKREFGLTRIIKMSSNECPYPPSAEIIEAIRKEAAQVNRYPDDACIKLKERLAEVLEVNKENIMVGHGSNELLTYLALSIINPGDEAFMAKPTFVLYSTVVKLMGGVAREVPLKDYRHDLKEMAKRVSEKTKLVFIANPNNPTGTIVYRDELDEFLSNLSRDILVVLDEAYPQFVKDRRYPDGLDYFKIRENIILLRTFSKVFSLAGLRVGFGLARKDIVEAVNKVRVPHNVNHLAQVAAIECLNPKYQPLIEERVKEVIRGRDYLREELEKMSFEVIPSEANFIFVDVKRDCKFVFNELLKRGIIVRTADIFGYPTSLRVTVGTEEENQALIEALKVII